MMPSGTLTAKASGRLKKKKQKKPASPTLFIGVTVNPDKQQGHGATACSCCAYLLFFRRTVKS